MINPNKLSYKNDIEQLYKTHMTVKEASQDKINKSLNIPYIYSSIAKNMMRCKLKNIHELALYLSLYKDLMPICTCIEISMFSLLQHFIDQFLDVKDLPWKKF